MAGYVVSSYQLLEFFLNNRHHVLLLRKTGLTSQQRQMFRLLFRKPQVD